MRIKHSSLGMIIKARGIKYANVTDLNRLDYMHILPFHVFAIAFKCRDLGYGIEQDTIEGFFTGDVDAFGKHTVMPVDGSAPYFFFPDEIRAIEQAR